MFCNEATRGARRDFTHQDLEEKEDDDIQQHIPSLLSKLLLYSHILYKKRQEGIGQYC